MHDKAIGIAAKFQEAAEFCDRLPTWPSRKEEFKTLLQIEADRGCGSILAACHRILKRVENEPFIMAFFMAATVEMYEPNHAVSTQHDQRRTT